MRQDRITKHLSLIFGILFFLSFTTSISAKSLNDNLVVFYKDKGRKGQSATFNTEGELLNIKEEIGFFPHSFSVKSKCKITVYSALAGGGKPTVYYTGDYDHVPFGTMTNMLHLPHIQSVVIEKAPEMPLVDVYFSLRDIQKSPNPLIISI
jgi:hypothetical protein